MKIISEEKTIEQAELLGNRVKKNYKQFAKRFAKENIDCFRLYDWDIPEIRATVDWYKGHLVISEYERLQTGERWLPQVAMGAALALGVEPENVHLKRRRTGGASSVENLRYDRIANTNKRFEVSERDIKLWVNLDDFIDTGLYSDHRDTRLLVQKIVNGKSFLNLFAYTGAFTCAAAKAGACHSVTVDRSINNLAWAKDNFDLNQLDSQKHLTVTSDVMKFLNKSIAENKKFEVAVVDPPSFYNDKDYDISFDILRDHPILLERVVQVMAPGATLFFSSNHQRFEPAFSKFKNCNIVELTPKTIPDDYRNKKFHRCWRFDLPT